MRLALTGDSIIQRRLLTRADPVVRPLFDMVRAVDIAFTNMEVLANNYRGEPAVESGGSHFGAPAWVIDELSDAGFDLFATATNHALDYGVSGLLHTLDALDARGVSYAGIGRTLEDARRPTYHAHASGTVAMVSCCTTFAKGQEAGAQTTDMPGRPGLAPLHIDTVHDVSAPQLAALREISEQLGLEAMRQYAIEAGFRFPPDDPAIFPVGSLNFRAAERTATRTKAKRKDVDAIVRWIDEARGLSDIVLVSIHSHDQGASKEDPPEFMPDLARHLVTAGADIVVCHGPHLLRGMEMINEKPVFYSLGNFVGQNELVPRIPADGYERFRADPTMTPGAVYQQRSNGDRAGFPADRRYWESVMPILTFDGRALVACDLHPISLGLGEARHLRGRPRLAAGAEAADILARFATLSQPFATSVRIEGDVATVALGGERS